MATAYSYKRFSSQKQEQGDSLRRQTKQAEAYAKLHGLELDTTLTLHDLGISAFKGDNVEKGALGLFVRAIDEGIVVEGSYLLVENLDRLSRQEVDLALELFLNITRKGINIVTLDDGHVYSRETIRENWTKLIIALAIMAGAHEQSKSKANRVGAAWAEKRNQLGTKRLTKMCPEWIRPTEDGWELVEDKANAVRRVYELFAEGYGKASIAKILNTENVVSLSGKGWYPNTVQNLINNRTVIGEFQAYTGRSPNRVPVGDPVPDYYPAVIDEELWKRAQRPRKTGGGKGYTEMVNVFRGLLKCPSCGGTITTFSSTRKDQSIGRVLSCHNYYRGLCKHKGRWKYHEFQNLFLSYVVEVDLQSIFADDNATKNAHNHVNNLRAEVAELERKVDNVAMSIVDNPSPTLNRLLRELEHKLFEAAKTLQQAQDEMVNKSRPTAAIKEELHEAIKKIEESGYRVRLNQALRQLITKIELRPNGTGINIASAQSDEVKLDTTPSFTVTFKNGLVRIVKADSWTTKLDLQK